MAVERVPGATGRLGEAVVALEREYEVQGASDPAGGAATWSPLGDWVVGSENSTVIQVGPAEMQSVYRVVAPHTKE